MDLNKQTYTFDDVLELIEILRGENGCPWDRVQTHQTLKKTAIEEAYELENAIDNASLPNLIEELGDMLMQVVLHASIAKASGEFDHGDIYTALCKKLIFRHSNVFGDVKTTNAKDALANWEKQKKLEHKHSSLTEYLSDIPQNMAALMQTQKTQSRASKSGYDFATVSDALDKLKSEIDELQAEINNGETGKLENEGGDLLFSAVNVLRMLNIDSETALLSSNRKFVNRVLACERQLDGKQLCELSQAEFDALWQRVKQSQCH